MFGWGANYCPHIHSCTYTNKFVKWLEIIKKYFKYFFYYCNQIMFYIDIFRYIPLISNALQAISLQVEESRARAPDRVREVFMSTSTKLRADSFTTLFPQTFSLHPVPSQQEPSCQWDRETSSYEQTIDLGVTYNINYYSSSSTVHNYVEFNEGRCFRLTIRLIDVSLLMEALPWSSRKQMMVINFGRINRREFHVVTFTFYGMRHSYISLVHLFR